MLFPHWPLLEMSVPVGRGGRIEVLDGVGTTVTKEKDDVVEVVEDVVGGGGGGGIEVLPVVGVGIGVGTGGKDVVDEVGSGSPSQYPYAP